MYAICLTAPYSDPPSRLLEPLIPVDKMTGLMKTQFSDDVEAESCRYHCSHVIFMLPSAIL